MKLSKALENIRVLDLSRVLAGPYCSMILGDLGAEIIKVEAPGGSDETRDWGPPFQEEVSAYYLCANRNKKSLTVNLKSEEGQQVIRQLVKESDVIIHNFKTGTMERLNLSYEELKQINPGLVYCSITGFGETGPYKDFPGYDFIIQAMSGLMSITGTEESGPQKIGVAMTDILTGLYACIGIEAALLERIESGEGQKLDISLYDSAVSSLVNIASNYLMAEKIPERLGNQHANIVPYQTFDTSDGSLVIAVGNDRQFAQLVKFLGQPDLADDPRFQTNSNRVENREILSKRLNELFKQESTAHWTFICRENNIPCGPIQNVSDLTDDSQLQERNMFINQEHPIAGDIRLVGSPLKFSKTPVVYNDHPPTAGEHNEELLRSIGYTKEDIQKMKNDHII